MSNLFPELVESLLYELRKELSLNILREKHIRTFESFERNLRALCAKASDAEEEIKKADAVLDGTKKRERQDDWLVEFNEIENEVGALQSKITAKGFVSGFFEGCSAAKLDLKLQELLGHTQQFRELKVHVYDKGREPLSTKRLVGIEFQENVDKIVSILKGKNMSRVAIHGMGGIGKTELAKHIHNHLLENTKAWVVWITVSQEFTIWSMQDEIAKGVGLDLSDDDNEDERSLRLYLTLSKMS